jgi:hypothetical protein
MNPNSHKTLLATLGERFSSHRQRHPGFDWARVQARLAAQPARLSALQQMEATGGEPDVIAHDETTGEYLFADCSPESPAGRRSLCYDAEALQARKENKPAGSAAGLAAAMGAELMTEKQYRALQRLGVFDQKTSSWVQTPADIRRLGGALFCDWRYGHVFVYHNGAQSYYAARGFRCVLRV